MVPDLIKKNCARILTTVKPDFEAKNGMRNAATVGRLVDFWA
jgi:hypothetical protein